MEIKAKSKFDLDAMKALTHLFLFRKADPIKRMGFHAFVYAALLAVVVWELIEFGLDPTTLTLLIVIPVVYCLISFMFFLLPKIRYRGLGKFKDMENTFLFGDDRLKVSSRSDAYIGEAEIQYGVFVKAFETSRYFFLFQNDSQVYIVDKMTIEGGTAEDIKTKFLPLLGKKYILCNY